MSKLEKFYSKSPIPVQTFFLNCKAIELYFERYGKKFRKVYEEFGKNQWLSEAELQTCQNEKLKNLVRHAYQTVHFYYEQMKRNNLRPDDIQTIHDLPKLPVINKETIKNNFKSLLSSAFSKRSIRHGHTSGTTGTPLHVCYNIATCVVHHAADWRQKNWAGLEYGEPYASIQGRVIVPVNQKKEPFWRKNYVNNQLFLSAFHLKEENLPAYFEKLEKDGIRYIEGYPSTLYILALYLNQRNKTFPIKGVLTSSETLFDFQRRGIEKAFECEVFDFYGMAERVIFASECKAHEGHHLNTDYGIYEFLDSDNNPAKDGEMGRIVATGLYNYAMPLLRYQTNDVSAVKQENCSCGRGFPLMEDVTTKEESIISLPDGRLISPSILTHPFKPMNNIIESQILQEKRDELIVKIVKAEKYGKKDEDMLIRGFQDRIGKDIKIVIQYVDNIPRSNSGKLKWVVSSIQPRFEF